MPFSFCRLFGKNMIPISALLFKDEPVFLKPFAAPECVFNLYPISFTIYFFKGESIINNCRPSKKDLGQLELSPGAHLLFYLKDLGPYHYLKFLYL